MDSFVSPSLKLIVFSMHPILCHEYFRIQTSLVQWRFISFEIRYFFSSKNEETLFEGNCNAKGQLLSNSFLEPIIKAQVFVNQQTPHPSLHSSGSSTSVKEHFWCQFGDIIIIPWFYEVFLKTHYSDKTSKWKRFTQESQITSFEKEKPVPPFF